jgi:hypothetical protein
MGDAWKALRELEGMRSEFNGSDGGALFGAHVEHVGNQTTHRGKCMSCFGRNGLGFCGRMGYNSMHLESGDSSQREKNFTPRTIRTQ